MTNEGIEEYRPTVEAIAGRMSGRVPNHIGLDELISAGFLGLLEAEEKFDPANGASFKTFASHRIAGAIRDYLRSLDWVPRSVRTKERDLDAAYARLRAEQGTEPDPEDVASALGLDLADFYMLEAETAPRGVMGYNMPAGTDEDGELSECIADPSATSGASVADRELIEIALDSLTEQEREVAVRIYLRDEKARAVAADMGLTESRISQLRKLAREKMGERLAAL